jgi:histidine triad (HIT) family protein
MKMPAPDEEGQQDPKQQCIFCQIIAGKVASRKVYEDERCIAILDINPANPGHVLIMPKEHQSILPLMREEEASHLFKVAKRVSMAQIRALKADGTNIFVANGAAAGQKSPHLMIHVIPRRENDGITAFSLPKNTIGGEDQDKLRVAIKNKVNEHFGIKEKEPVKIEAPKPEKVEHIAPPEEMEDETVLEDTVPPEEAMSKKKFDLDSISRLFGK